MTELLNQIGDAGITFDWLANLGVALAILIVGWIVAKVLAAVVGRLLRTVDVDQRVASATGATNLGIERFAGTVVFYLTMLAVLMLFFDRLDLTAINQPLEDLLATVLGALPGVAWALALLLLAWLIATVVRNLVTRAANATNLDARLTEEAAMDAEQPLSLADSLATAAYYLVFLFFLPAILGQLGMTEVAEPVTDLLGDILGFLPNIFGAAIFLLIGYFVARILRQIVTNLLAASGADRVGARVGLDDGLRLSSLAGTLVYALVLIPVAISALEKLRIDAISGPATVMLETIFNALPGLLAAAAILLFSWYIGRLVADMTANLLSGVGFDRFMSQIGLRQYSEETGGRRPSEVVGYVILFFIMLFATVSAAESIGFAMLGDIVRDFTAFGGKVVLGVVVLGVGVYFANLLRDVVSGSGIGGEHTATIAAVARIAVLLLAVVTALDQVLPDSALIGSVLTELIGAIGLGVAIAFGVAFGFGGRKAAARVLDRRIQ